MADQSISVSGPVSIQSDSAHRVALALAEKIYSTEARDTKIDRKYWLTLYGQCRAVVIHGRDAKQVLAGE